MPWSPSAPHMERSLHPMDQNLLLHLSSVGATRHRYRPRKSLETARASLGQPWSLKTQERAENKVCSTRRTGQAGPAGSFGVPATVLALQSLWPAAAHLGREITQASKDIIHSQRSQGGEIRKLPDRTRGPCKHAAICGWSRGTPQTWARNLASGEESNVTKATSHRSGKHHPQHSQLTGSHANIQPLPSV